jgi:hypothetical protein
MIGKNKFMVKGMDIACMSICIEMGKITDRCGWLKKTRRGYCASPCWQNKISESVP